MQQVIAEAHQHVTSDLVSRLINEFHATNAQPTSAAHGTLSPHSSLPEEMELEGDAANGQALHHQLPYSQQSIEVPATRKRRPSVDLEMFSNRKRGRSDAILIGTPAATDGIGNTSDAMMMDT